MVKILFMGTPKFAIPALKALLASEHKVVAIVTQPDRPRGRYLKFTPPPVKEVALKERIPLFQPATLNEETKKELAEVRPDLGVVVAYGKILPSWLLRLPKYGFLNVHPSLLPQYRGAAPIIRAIMDGKSKTGVSIQVMEESLDTGDILLQSPVLIEAEDTAGRLEKKLSKVAAEILLLTIDKLEKGTLAPIKQEKSEVSYAPKIEKDEAQINWAKPAYKIKNLIRALNPLPGAYTFFKGKRLKVWQAKSSSKFKVQSSKLRKPGIVVDIGKEELVVATATEPLVLMEVQPENRNKMRASEFTRGYPVKVGDKLG